MKNLAPALSALVLSVALNAPAHPEAKEGMERCTLPTQQCLDQLARDLAGRGWLGIQMEEQQDGTVKVAGVVPDSPAARAGLQAGDVLVSVNGTSFAKASPDDLGKATSDWKPGSRVTYVVSRDGSERTVAATLAEMPQQVADQILGHHMMMHANLGEAKTSKLDEMTVDQVAQLVAAGKGVILDANGPDLRKSHGVVPGARLLTSSTSYDVAKELPADKDQLLVFYCANPRCMASEMAARRAQDAGHSHVAVMRAGIMGWKDAGQRTQPAS